MSIPGVDLSNMGGRYNAVLGMLLEVTDFNNGGEMAMQTLMGVLSILFYDNGIQEPISGFPLTTEADPNCLAVTTGDLAFNVPRGFGIVHDNSKVDADPFFAQAYRIAVVTAVTGGTLAAHDPTDPRIDMIILTPARVPLQPDGRDIKDPITGALSVDPGVDLKNSLGATVSVITGTPAVVPVPPAVPVGSLAIAQAIVPSGSGPAVLGDARQPLHVGPFVKGAPGNEQYLLDHVQPNTPVDFLVFPSGGFLISMSSGRAVIDGVTRQYFSRDLLISTADPTDPRIDLVIARRNGNISVLVGTPAPTPVVPTLPANAYAITEIAVGAGATAIDLPDITRVAEESWMSGAGIRDLTLLHQAMTVRPWVIVATGVSNPDPDVIQITYEVRYPNGAAYDGSFPLDVVIESYTRAGQIDGIVGTIYVPSSGALRYFQDTQFEMDVGLIGDTAIFPFTGFDRTGPTITAGTSISGSERPRMIGEVTAQTFLIEIGRRTDTTPIGKMLIAAYPVGSSAPTAGAGFQAIEFT